jgi:hypothetical protein
MANQTRISNRLRASRSRTSIIAQVLPQHGGGDSARYRTADHGFIRWPLIRRSVTDPNELAYYLYCGARVAGTR